MVATSWREGFVFSMREKGVDVKHRRLTRQERSSWQNWLDPQAYKLRVGNKSWYAVGTQYTFMVSTRPLVTQNVAKLPILRMWGGDIAHQIHMYSNVFMGAEAPDPIGLILAMNS